MTMRKVVRGFTLLELVVVVCIVAVLMGTFMNRVLYYRERAEKTAMEGMAASIQSALTMRYGMILLHGQSSDLAALAKENPVNWLQKKPENYAGEFFDPTPGAVSPGNWLYDLKSGELIYVPASAYYLEPDKGGAQMGALPCRFQPGSPATCVAAAGGHADQRVVRAGRALFLVLSVECSPSYLAWHHGPSRRSPYPLAFARAVPARRGAFRRGPGAADDPPPGLAGAHG